MQLKIDDSLVLEITPADFGSVAEVVAHDTGVDGSFDRTSAVRRVPTAKLRALGRAISAYADCLDALVAYHEEAAG